MQFSAGKFILVPELGFSTDKSDQRDEILGKNNKFAKCDVIHS